MNGKGKKKRRSCGVRNEENRKAIFVSGKEVETKEKNLSEGTYQEKKQHERKSTIISN